MTDVPKFDDLPDESQASAVPKFDDMPDHSQSAQHAPTFMEAVGGLMPAPISAVTEGAKNISEGFSPSKPTSGWERAQNVASGVFDVATPGLPRGYRKNLKDKVNEGLAAINESLNPYSETQKKLFKQEMAHPGIGSAWEKFKSVGSGLGGIGEVALSPLTAATKTAAPLVAAPEATLFAQPDKINPLTGKHQTREQLYQEIEPGTEMAFGAMMPGKLPARVPVRPPPKPEAPFGVNLSVPQETRSIHDLTTQYAAETGKMEPATTEQGKPLPRPITEFAQERAAERAQQVEAAKDIATAQLDPAGNIHARTAEEAGQTVKDALQAQEAERARQAAAEAERLRAKSIQSPSEAAEVVHDALTQHAAERAAGTEAQTTAQAADREGFRTSLSPDGQVYARTPQEAGDVLSAGITRAEEQATATRDALYDRWQSNPGGFEPKAFTKVDQEVNKKAFNDPKDPFLLNEKTTPATIQGQRILETDLAEPARVAADPKTKSFAPFTLAKIDNVRKKLNFLYRQANNSARATNDYSDVAGMGRLIDAFDDVVERGLTAKGMFSGDGRQTLADWQAARAAHRYLRETFSPQGRGDTVGPTMAKIIGQREGQAMPADDIGRMVVSGNQQSTLLGRRLRALFPEGSPEHAAAKQAIWSHTVDVPEGVAPLSPQKMADNIDKLRSSGLAREWFSPEELAAMRQHAIDIRSSVPPPRPKTDTVGKTVEDIVGEGGTPWTREQLAEKLYSKHGPESEKLVQHIKDTFGADSEAFQAVQRGQLAELSRAEEGVAGFDPEAIAKDVRDFLRTDKSKILYTPEMRQRLAQYADQLEMHALETAPSKDPVQKALARLRDASPQEAANMLLGKTETGIKLDVIRHLRKTAPDTVVALRQAIFRKMIEPPADQINSWTPRKVHKQIADYRGKTPGVMRELFGPEGVKVLDEYQELQNKLHIPDEAKKNWNMPGFSRVVAAINKKASSYFHLVIGALGFHASGGNPWVTAAAAAGSKFAGNWVASRVQANAARRQMAELRRLLPTAAEKLTAWQKAVDAAHRANQQPVYRQRALAAWNDASQVFDKLGIPLHRLLFGGTAAADEEENKRRVEKKRADGGRVEDDSAHDIDTLATGAGAIGEQSPLIQMLARAAKIGDERFATPATPEPAVADHSPAPSVSPWEAAAARARRRAPLHPGRDYDTTFGDIYRNLAAADRERAKRKVEYRDRSMPVPEDSAEDVAAFQLARKYPLRKPDPASLAASEGKVGFGDVAEAKGAQTLQTMADAQREAAKLSRGDPDFDPGPSMRVAMGAATTAFPFAERGAIGAFGGHLNPEGGLVRRAADEAGAAAAVKVPEAVPKATVEFGTTQTNVGKAAHEVYQQAVAAGDEQLQRRYTEPLVEAMQASTQGEDTPWQSLRRAIVGEAEPTPGAAAYPTKEFPLDVGGTFEGAVSPNIRIPLEGMTDPQIEAFNAVAGRHLRQDAMATSTFRPAVGDVAPEGYVQTHSIFVPTAEQLTPDEIRSFAKAMGAEGHGMSYERLPDGYQFDVLPAFTADGVKGADAAAVGRAYDASIGAKYGPAEISPRDFKSVYTEAGDYDKVRTNLVESIKNDFIKDAANAGITEDYARQILAGSRPPSSLPGGAEQVWERYQSRLGDLARAEDSFKGLAERIADAHADYLTSAEKRVAPEALPLTPAAAESENRVSTRLPTGATSTHDPMAPERLGIGVAEMKATPKSKSRPNDPSLFEKNVDRVRDYPNLSEAERTGTHDEVAKSFVDHVRDNLIWLYNQVPEEIRGRSKLWYEGAHRLTKELSDRYNVNHNSSAAATAALSPQKDWNQNVSLAHRVHEIHFNKRDEMYSPEMAAKAKEIYEKEDLAALNKKIEGKRYSELTDPFEQAAWLRLYDEAHFSPDYYIITPEGYTSHIARNDDGKASKVAWGSGVEIAKAIQALEAAGDLHKITPLLGEQHKVRNFYNNIIAPNSKHGDVTIDTHAVAAALLRALSQGSPEVAHNFGSNPLTKKWLALRQARPDLNLPEKFPGTSSSSITGVNGTYGLYADAYRAAAKVLGILPRELQSITWEAIRSLFPDTFKNHANGKVIDGIWRDYQKGVISIDEARQKVLAYAAGEKGRITPPDWHRPASELDAEKPHPTDTGALPESGVSDRAAGTLGRRAGGAVASRDSCHWCSLIDTKHDVKSGADSSARRVVIDRHIPEFSPTLKTRNGKPANLHKYLSRHERAEALGMRSGLSYADAHDKRAVPAERSAVRGDGVDWDAYNREMAGYLSHVEHEQVRKPPPGKLHVDPDKAVKTRQSGGGVIRGDQMSPLKSEHITENDLRDFNRQMERNLKSPMAGEMELEGGQRSENDRYGVPREPIQKLYDFWDRGEEVSLTRQSGGGVLDWAYAPSGKLDLSTPASKNAYAAGYERDPPPLAKPPIAGSYEDGRAGLDLTMSGEGSSGAIGASVDPFKPSSWGVRGRYTKDITAGRAAGGRVVVANVNHRPTPGQQKAGNYAKDHVCIHGLDITIENARGSTRRGVGADGKPWKSRLPAHYGYIKRTEGADGDHVDVYLGPHTSSSRVWVIDQVDPDKGAFDEHKTFLGFASKAQVVRTYRGAFSDGRGLERLGAIKEMTVEGFKDWLKGDTSKPLNGKVPTAEPMIQRDAFQYHTQAKGDRCDVCRYYSGPQQGCGLYRMINQRMPEDFDLNPQVARDGWCSAFTSKSAKA